MYDELNEFIEEDLLNNEQGNIILNASTDIGMVILQLEDQNGKTKDIE